jgi:hypothetical protein
MGVREQNRVNTTVLGDNTQKNLSISADVNRKQGSVTARI